MSRFNKQHISSFKAQFCYTPTFKTLSASDSFPVLANTNNKKYGSTDSNTFAHKLSSGTAGFRMVHFLVLKEPQCCFTKWASYLTTLTKTYRNSFSSWVLTTLAIFHFGWWFSFTFLWITDLLAIWVPFREFQSLASVNQNWFVME